MAPAPNTPDLATELGLEVPMDELFRHPTVTQIAARLADPPNA